MKAKVINHYLQPITLEDGTTVAASGTDGSVKDVTLSDGDKKRYVRPDMLVILDVPSSTPAQNSSPALDDPSAKRKESK